MERDELVRRRFERLFRDRRLSRRDADRFLELDLAMTGGPGGDRAAMSAFHDGREYRALLEKIVGGLAAVGEPHAAEKMSLVVEEIATMGPGVFLTPWEMTLEYLDRHVGRLEDVEKAYE